MNARGLQVADEVVAAHLEEGCDVVQNPGERSNPERIVARDRDVVLAALGGDREADVATDLPGRAIAALRESPDQGVAGDVAREPQTARTSSWTKCSRTTRGAAPSSK